MTVVTPTWYSNDEAIVTVSQSGLLTVIGYGRTLVSATFQGLSESVNVQALPKGTFILTGNVSEANGAGGIDGAAVSLKGGTVSGSRSTTADEYGFYRFAGVAGPMTISATHAGYVRKDTSVTVAGDLVADIELTPANPPANIAGTYRLTIDASASCGARLPEAARSRTYTATIEQDGANLSVSLSGAEFIEADGHSVGDHFSGRILGRQATFYLARFRYDSYYGTFIYGVVEKLNEQYLAIDGDAETSVTASTISGALAGDIDVYNGNPAEGGIRTITCADDNHRLTFSR